MNTAASSDSPHQSARAPRFQPPVRRALTARRARWDYQMQSVPTNVYSPRTQGLNAVRLVLEAFVVVATVLNVALEMRDIVGHLRKFQLLECRPAPTLCENRSGWTQDEVWAALELVL